MEADEGLSRRGEANKGLPWRGELAGEMEVASNSFSCVADDEVDNADADEADDDDEEVEEDEEEEEEVPLVKCKPTRFRGRGAARTIGLTSLLHPPEPDKTRVVIQT